MNDRQILRSCQRTKKKAMEHKAVCNNCSFEIEIIYSTKTIQNISTNGPQRSGKQRRGTKNQKKKRNYPDLNIVDISENALKIPENLRRLAVTKNPVKDYQLNLLGKLTRNEIIELANSCNLSFQRTIKRK